MIENGTDVQKRPCGPGQLASEFGINFGKNRYDFCIRTIAMTRNRITKILVSFTSIPSMERPLFLPQ